MVNSGIFSKNLYTFRTQTGLTQREVADMIGVRQQTVAAWEANRSTPSPDIVCSLAKIFGITTDELLLYPLQREQHWPKRRVMVPVVDTIKTDIASYAEGEISGYELIEGRYGAEYIYYKMSDGSMEPKIYRGDLLLIELCADAENGEIAAAIADDGSGLIRKIVRQEQGIILQPLSSEYPLQFLPQESLYTLKIVGRVVKTQREW